MCTIYCSLTELTDELDERGIRYKEVNNDDGIFVYVNELMQIREQYEQHRKKFYPTVRVSYHRGDIGYYVRDCGVIYEDVSLEDVIDIIENCIND